MTLSRTTTVPGFKSDVEEVLQEIRAILPRHPFTYTIEDVESKEFEGITVSIVPRNEAAAKIALAYEVRYQELQLVIGEGLLIEIFPEPDDLASNMAYIKDILLAVMKDGVQMRRWTATGATIRASARLRIGGKDRRIASGTLFGFLRGRCRREDISYQPYSS